MSRKENIYSQGSSDISMYTAVTVSQNEPMLNEVMNRSIGELELNNLALDQLNKIVFSELNISEYIQGSTYNVGDLVWYKDSNGNTFLLRCIIQSNSNVPDTFALNGSSYTKYGDERLNRSGWENQNKNLSILGYDVMSLVNENAEAIVQEHEEDLSMHPYGKLDDLRNNLLQSDFSNISRQTQKTFFPEQAIRLPSGIATITGYQRDFNNIVEYDIILKLASNNVVSHNQLFEDVSPLSANSTSFEIFSGVSQSSVQFQQNKNYFKAVSDMNMLAPSSSMHSRCGIINQYQRNDYVNTYTAKIVFPQEFSSLDYMVFSNTILSQTIRDKTTVPSANEITYCDKTRQSITFINITFPDSTMYGQPGWNATHGGLVANSFHMKVIGQIGA